MEMKERAPRKHEEPWKQAEAEQERRAKIINAEGELQAAESSAKRPGRWSAPL